MELKEAVRERRSVRHFKAEPVPHEVIMEIMEDVRFVPSWKNTQVARYYLVEDPALKARFDEGEFCYGFTYNAGTLKRAPQVMVMAYRKGISGHEKDGSNATPKGDDFWEAFDCGIAAQTFCLLAHERGIGTVIQGYFDDRFSSTNRGGPHVHGEIPTKTLFLVRARLAIWNLMVQRNHLA